MTEDSGETTKIALVGSGLIGRAWAISFARAGFHVALWDPDPAASEAALGFVSEILADLAQHDLLNGAAPAEVLARIAPERELGAALAGAVHVQESTPEQIEVKQRVFASLDEAAPASAVIASSSSALLPSHFTEALKGRGRCLVVHPINPPYLIPAAEVVPAPWTTAETVERTRALLVRAGHAPIVMQRELDGFVMNRLQGALLEEAFRLVDEGYASVEDVDIGIRDGLALRWSFMGPFETIDLNAPGGVADYVARYQGLFRNIFGQTRHRADWAGPVLARVLAQRRARLPEERLGERQLWRDRRLIALAAHKKRSDRDIGE